MPELRQDSDDQTGAAMFGSYLAEDLNVVRSAIPVCRAALRRQAAVWCLTGLAGLGLGLGGTLVLKPVHRASISVLLTQNPNESALTDVALAQSRTVARHALRASGLAEDVTSFQSSYKVVLVTSRVLQFTVGAPSAAGASKAAKALARAFLWFRGTVVMAQEKGTISALHVQLAQARDQVDSITGQLTRLRTSPSSAASLARIRVLQFQRRQALGDLSSLEQQSVGYLTLLRTGTASLMAGNRVLGAVATVPGSILREPLVLALIGLVGGLLVGLGVVVMGALLSDRPRRRDEVAAMLKEPVSLSVGRVRASRRCDRRPGAVAGDASVQRVTGHLRRSLPSTAGVPAALSVVALGDARVAAQSVAALAVSLADDGVSVLLADLAAGAPLARFFRVRRPGLHAVRAAGAPVTLLVPDPADVTPLGPLPADRAGRGRPVASADLATAFSSADVVLTLATIAPGLGAEHLATWATGAVIVTTSGAASATRLEAVGRMIRLAGFMQVSAGLLGADRADESYGGLMRDESASLSAQAAHLGRAGA